MPLGVACVFRLEVIGLVLSRVGGVRILALGGRLAPREDRLLVYCGCWCCFVCDFRAFNAERWKTARGDDGNLSIEYGLWRRKCFRQGRAVFCGGFEALGFGLVQVVGLRLDQGGRSCRRWMAKLGRWLCSLGILQNNF